MKRSIFVLSIALAAALGPVVADTSKLPVPEGAIEAAIGEAVGTAAPGRSLRPEPRPTLRQGAQQNAQQGSAAQSDATQVTKATRPKERKGFLRRIFKRKPKEEKKKETLAGSVCGVPGIKGTAIAPIQSRTRGCGVSDPVQLTSVGGVRLTQRATIDCPTAKALYGWVENSVKPTIGKTGGGVVSLRVAAHYACRTRNSQKGARISEHGKGRAIDISAFNLADGSAITVLQGWRHKTYGPMLQKVHREACGPFGTVLGPRADRFHQDHFHFDTARYRSGSYCR